MFCFHDTDRGVGVAFTDRHGGVSTPPYDSLNLGTATADDPVSVTRNYDLVASAVGVGAGGIALMRQVHGADVAVLRQPPPPDRLPEVDALVTDRPGMVLSVRVADCVPVLLADPSAGVVGCVHAGRAGLAAGVVPDAVQAMRELGARRVRAWVGPHVCGGCYEVPEQMQEEVAGVVPEARSTTAWGTPALDLGAGVEAQLRANDCVVAAAPRRCTREDPDLFSHRRDGDRAGRFAGLVWLRS
ncbi:MAG: peptidoglycan editing factor PgeF [Actinomycetota bacterium]|nr:peptidoglycan editing factor PgeF [Actinomycetota bacterium]